MIYLIKSKFEGGVCKFKFQGHLQIVIAIYFDI